MRTQELRDENEPHSVEELEFKQRSIHIWALDLDKVKRIILAPENIDHLVAAFLGNNPYYPRPDVDRELWICFRNIIVLFGTPNAQSSTRRSTKTPIYL